MQGIHEVTEDFYKVTHEVGPNQTGIRLDSFLKSFYSNRSRQSIQKAIEDGRITLKRDQSPHLKAGRLKPGYTLVGGDEVEILTMRKPEPPVNFNYKILFEDDTHFVIDKPANLPVHPAGRYYFNTLLVHLGRKLFLAHRIDKETSGILILTKTSEACAWLTEQFKIKTIQKKYLAIVKGQTPDHFSVDLPIGRATDSEISLKMGVTSVQDGGSASLTEFKRLKTIESKLGTFSLVECTPKTGRQHQIRLHLLSQGHPIVGDKLYGLPEKEALKLFERSNLSPEAKASLIMPRHALHSCELGFPLSEGKKSMLFKSPIPPDMASFMQNPDSWGTHMWTPENSGLFEEQHSLSKFDENLDL